MHVLCAPPAFILSQDQTLLLMVSIFRLSTLYKSFWVLAHFKFNLLVTISYDILPFGLSSLKDNYCLLFNVLFYSILSAEQSVLYYTIFSLSTLFMKIFKNIFYLILRQNKKLVNHCFHYIIVVRFLLLILVYFILFSSVDWYLIDINILCR